MGLRILIVASEVPPLVSGVARSVGDLVDGLRSRGHTVDVLSAADAPYLKRGDLRLSALALHVPDVRRRSADYDVINIHGPAPSITEVFLAGVGRWRRRNKPAVVYTHHFTMEMPQRWLAPPVAVYNRALLVLARRADAVVVTSASYASLVERTGVTNATIIPWGIRPSTDRGAIAGVGPAQPDGTNNDAADRSPTDQLRVLYVGQLRPYKGADIAIEAVRRLTGVTLKVIGTGPMAEQLAQQAAGLPAGRVELLGFCNNTSLGSWYRWADVVALPSTSRLEAFGLVLVEGMSAGCVPVASDLPGVRDVVDGSGLLAAANDPDDLAWALALLARRTELLSCLRQKSLERARSFTVTKTVDQYEELFMRLDSVVS